MFDNKDQCAHTLLVSLELLSVSKKAGLVHFQNLLKRMIDCHKRQKIGCKIDLAAQRISA